MELAKIEVNDFGGAPAAEHNIPCPVCGKKAAVLALGTGVFGPCWTCKSKGWLTLRVKPWQLWLLKRIFGEHHHHDLHSVKGKV